MRNHFRSCRDLSTRLSFTLAAGLVLCAGTGCQRRAAPAVVADLVVTGGKIVTVDKDNSIKQALAVKAGKIIAIGTDEEIQPLAGQGTTTVNAQGRTIIPGLIDSHGHHVSTAIGDLQTVDLSQEAGVKSIADIQQKIAERVKSIPKGSTIRCGREDDFKLQEKRHPTRQELDQAAPDNPVQVTTVGGHFSVFNSKALQLAGVTKKTPDPPGGRLGRDPKTGELTGFAYDGGVGLISSHLPPVPEPSAAEKEAAVRKLLLEAASTGLTCVYNTASKTDFETTLSLRDKGQLPIRFRGDLPIRGGIETLKAIGMTSKPVGDEWVKYCGLKFVMDGAISARTAYVSEPYLNQPDFHGVLATTKEEATQLINAAFENGLRVNTHANGDATLNMYLDIIEAAQKAHPIPDARNMIIHCTVVNPEIIARIKRLDLYPTIFGAYAYYHGDKLLPAFGEKRLESMFAARSFLDAGVKVAAHSDYSASPYPPLMGIHALVNRVTSSGKPIGQSQKISVTEALKLYTTNAAYQSFDENLLGSLEVGKAADMVVLGRDILTEAPSSIIDTPIDMTFVNGKAVFERK